MKRYNYKHKYLKYRTKYLNLKQHMQHTQHTQQMHGGDFTPSIGDRVRLVDEELLGTVLSINNLNIPDPENWIYTVKADNGITYKKTVKELKTISFLQ